jgi:uncharacterized SAM-binding protein YcdF (DUF218 family)
MLQVKKLIGLLTKPGTLALMLLGYGIFQLIRSPHSRKKGLVLVGVGLGCFYLFSTAPLPNSLIYTLESRYKPVTSAHNLSAIQYIVVLSGDLRQNEQVPPTSQLAVTTTLRVAEAVRLFYLLGGTPVLVMSGGGAWEGEMAALAQSLGVPSARLASATHSQDTHGNAVGVRAIVRDQPFLLVTSASHMPRAVKIFRTLGMEPQAAPADYRYSRRSSLKSFLPSGSSLTTMECVIHEYLGLAYLDLFPGRAGK